MTITKETAKGCFGISSEAPEVKLECPACSWEGSSKECRIDRVDWTYICPDCAWDINPTRSNQ